MTEQTFWRLRVSTVLLSVLPLAFTFVLVLFVKNINHFFNVWDKDIRVSVFMKEMSATQDILEIKKILSTDERVKNFEYYDQERSFTEFKQQMPDLLDESFSEDQFFQLMPVSFQVSLKNLDDAKSIQKLLQDKPGVQSAYMSEDFFEKYLKLRTGVGLLSVVFVFIMLVFLSLIINYSIQQMIYLQAEEISILEMLGATSKFVRKPIFIEIILINAFSSFVSLCVCLIAYFGFYKIVSRYFGFLQLQKQIVFFHFWEILLLLLVPLVVSSLSAFFALKKVNSGWGHVKV